MATTPATTPATPFLVVVVALLSFLSIVSSEVFFEERFDDGWENRWVISDWKKAKNMSGEWNHTCGKWNPYPNDKGIQTSGDYKFFAISSKFQRFNNKNRTLVLQFSVKHEQKIDCGGGYIKLLSGVVNQKKFGSKTPYSIMFGPDFCGYIRRKVQAILTRNGTNFPIKRDVPSEIDQMTHVYTFILRANATYSILIDNDEKQNGSLYSDWAILPPKRIKDPEAKKPEDWDERKYIPDLEDKKPEVVRPCNWAYDLSAVPEERYQAVLMNAVSPGYDDIPMEIPDPEAVKPENWNTDEDGEWTAPTIKNPEYNGPWKPKKIKNPNYKGKWEAPMIDNPDFKDDPDIYVFRNLNYVGIELWQVKSGTLFDNILLTDDPEYARKFAEETWGKLKDAEKAAFDEEEKRKKEEEEKNEADEEYDDDEDIGSDDEDEADASDSDAQAEDVNDEL